MNALFAETLKRLRKEKGLTQKELADQINITRSAIAQWESGRNLPDAVMFSRLYKVLGEEARMLLDAAALSDEAPNVIMVDDIKPIVNGGVSTLQEVMPNVTVTGFTKAADAIERAGIPAPARCRSGECGWCRSKLVSGTVYIPAENDTGRRFADKVCGYIHPCASFPTSDIVIEVPGSYMQ